MFRILIYGDGYLCTVHLAANIDDGKGHDSSKVIMYM